MLRRRSGWIEEEEWVGLDRGRHRTGRRPVSGRWGMMGHTTLSQSRDGGEGVVEGELVVHMGGCVGVHIPSLPAVVLGHLI